MIGTEGGECTRVRKVGTRKSEDGPSSERESGKAIVRLDPLLFHNDWGHSRVLFTVHCPSQSGQFGSKMRRRLKSELAFSFAASRQRGLSLSWKVRNLQRISGVYPCLRRKRNRPGWREPTTYAVYDWCIDAWVGALMMDAWQLFFERLVKNQQHGHGCSPPFWVFALDVRAWILSDLTSTLTGLLDRLD